METLKKIKMNAILLSHSNREVLWHEAYKTHAHLQFPLCSPGEVSVPPLHSPHCPHNT